MRFKKVMTGVLLGSMLMTQTAFGSDLAFTDDLSTITVEEDTKIYAEPSTDAAGVAYLMAGDSVQQLAAAEGWAKIVYQDQICYVQIAADAQSENTASAEEAAASQGGLAGAVQTSEGEETAAEGKSIEAALPTDGVVILDGQVITLPCQISDLEALGWTVNENYDKETVLSTDPGSIYQMFLSKNNASIEVTVNNSGAEAERAAKDCPVWGLTIQRSNLEESGMSLVLPGNFVMQDSSVNVDAIVSAYGTPNYRDNGDITYLSFQDRDRKNEIAVRVDTVNGGISEVNLQIAALTEGYTFGETGYVPDTAAAEVPAAEDTEEEAPAESSAEEGTEETPAEASAESAQNSSETTWYDQEILMNEAAFTFPTDFATLTANGWTAEEAEDLEESLQPSYYSDVEMQNNGTTAEFYFVNHGINTIPMSEGVVGGFEAEIDGYSDDVPPAIVLPGNITFGVSTVDEVRAAYGEPDSESNSEYSISLEYNANNYSNQLRLEFDPETQVLQEIRFKDMRVPEGFDAGEVSQEVPEDIAAYVKPETMEDALKSDGYQCSLDGVVYSLPLPLSVLFENGWSMDEDDQGKVVSGRDYDYCRIEKGDASISVSLVNNSEAGQSAENTWVYSLGVSSYDDLEFAFPFGITLGTTTEEELLKVFAENGISEGEGGYTIEDGDGYRVYYFNTIEKYNYYEVTIETDEDGSVPAGTVRRMEIKADPRKLSQE